MVFGSAVTRTDAITRTHTLREIVIPDSFKDEVDSASGSLRANRM
jgi:hypothetical protein